ncbi:DUF4232 domain-containing protein [Nocardia carnea]|uniref:DUF4232 domain-containing protein n=1 Tax=Nocardia carnea TaxID=37328 RepID=UPI00245902A1|nr:DUF4232 domain-containing protein [Nocardia carnea]
MTSTKWRAAGTAGAAIAALAAMMIPAATSAAAPTLCTARTLDLSTRERPSDTPGQARMEVVLTNTSAQACAVQGFPGVALVGPEDPTFGPIYELPRQDVNFAPVVVEPGSAVSSVLTYLPDALDGWVPATLVVTPPDTTDRIEAPWPAGVSVQRQDGATHPGTYIGPLQPAS